MFGVRLDLHDSVSGRLFQRLGLHRETVDVGPRLGPRVFDITARDPGPISPSGDACFTAICRSSIGADQAPTPPRKNIDSLAAVGNSAVKSYICGVFIMNRNSSTAAFDSGLRLSIPS